MSFLIQESFDVSRQTLTRLIRIVDEIIGGTLGHPAGHAGLSDSFRGRPETKIVLPAMLQALGSSTNTLVQLSNRPGLQTRDCFGISRSIVELAINVCYILAEGDKAAAQARRHAEQKAVRDLGRLSTVAKQSIRLRFTGFIDDKLSQEVRDSINEFTARSGREKDWTELSIDKRCEKVGERLGASVLTPLHWARFAVYRHASEALHGTFFSAAYFLGLTDPRGSPTSPADWLDRIGENHLMLLLSTAISILAVTRAIDAAFNAPILVNQAEQQIKHLETAPFFRVENK